MLTGPCDHGGVLVVTIAATMWLLISLAFIVDSVKGPLSLTRGALTLLAVEFVVLALGFSDLRCAGGPCAGVEGLSDLSQTIVSYVIPGLALALTLYAIGHGLARHCRAAG